MVVDHDREIYPSAPLRLVAAEIRYPLAPALLPGDAITRLALPLSTRFPLVFSTGAEISLPLGPSSPPLPTRGYRLVARDEMTSVTVTPTRMALETTNYLRWEAFRDDLELVLSVLGVEMAAVSGLERLGLRYVNEIRLPDVVEADAPLSTWNPYVRPNLLAPFEHAIRSSDGSLASGFVATDVDRSSDRKIAIRYGILMGHTVTGSPLRLPTSLRTDEYILLDIDSYTSPEGYGVFSLPEALVMADDLHDPVRLIFESFVTDRLREDVLRREHG